MALIEFKFEPDTNGKMRPVFSPEAKQQVKKVLGFENVETYEDDTEGREKGALGHPIMMPLVFDECNWEIQKSSGTERGRTDEMLLPVCMVTCSREKNMEETMMEGADGAVKELGGYRDYEVSIAGLLISTDALYPEKEVKQLIKIEEAKAKIGVTADLLIWLKVNHIVVRSIKWIPMEGVENAQAFELNCVQDRDYALTKKAG